MAPTSIDLWTNGSMAPIVNLDVLLPNGLIINLELSRETSLNEIREKVWQEASKFSSISSSLKLKDSINDYIFTSVSQEAKKIEYYDYTKRLCDLKLFCLFFKLIEVSGNLEEKTFNSDLSKAVGLYISEIEQINDEEIIDFRLSLFKQTRQSLNSDSSSRDSDEETTLTSYIECIYSPYLEIDPSLLDISFVNSKMNLINFNESKIEINIHINELDQPEMTYHIQIPLSFTPTDIISYIIKTKLKNMNQSEEQINSIVEKYKDTYMLSVCGCDEIFFGSKHKIGSYKVIKLISK